MCRPCSPRTGRRRHPVRRSGAVAADRECHPARSRAWAVGAAAAAPCSGPSAAAAGPARHDADALPPGAAPYRRPPGRGAGRRAPSPGRRRAHATELANHDASSSWTFRSEFSSDRRTRRVESRSAWSCQPSRPASSWRVDYRPRPWPRAVPAAYTVPCHLGEWPGRAADPGDHRRPQSALTSWARSRPAALTGRERRRGGHPIGVPHLPAACGVAGAGLRSPCRPMPPGRSPPRRPVSSRALSRDGLGVRQSAPAIDAAICMAREETGE
jgi:hypothetical protein